MVDNLSPTTNQHTRKHHRHHSLAPPALRKCNSEMSFDWEPPDCPKEVRISVVDDIANYRSFRILGTTPHRQHIPLVHRIFDDTVYATHNHMQNISPWASRAHHRGIWAKAWLIQCGGWGDVSHNSFNSYDISSNSLLCDPHELEDSYESYDWHV